MSDEQTPQPEAPRRPSGIFEHYCEHPGCKEWGSFGYARSKHIPSRWFCWEHREDGEALIR